MPNETRSLAEWTSSLNYSSLDAQVVEKSKLIILDWMGAATAGSDEQVGEILLKVLGSQSGPQESSIVSRGVKTNSMSAALINGSMAHSTQIDDITLIGTLSIHPASSVVSTALALGEVLGSDGRELVTSIVAGYEVEIRVAEAIMPDHYRFWHPTSTCGTLGAAVSACLLLGCSTEQVEMALGIAATQASGLVASFGTMCQPFHPGKAASNGILSALLAKEGFTSRQGILEDPRGLLSATTSRPDLSKLVSDLGSNLRIMNTAFKIYASPGSSLGTIDEVLKLREMVDPSELEEIFVRTNPIGAQYLGKDYSPATSAQAKFSLPFCVAVALLKGRLGPQEFSKELLSDASVLALMKKVKVIGDEGISNDKMGAAEVTLRTKEKTLRSKTDVPKGFPTNFLTAGEVKAKFIGLVSSFYGQEGASEVVRCVDNIENHRASDLMRLVGS